MLTFKGRRVPKPLQKVVQKRFRFWIVFLMVLGIFFDSKMLPKWHQNDPQSPPGDPQGVTWDHQGAQESPRTYFFLQFWHYFGLIFEHVLYYFGAVFVMCLFFVGCCLISLFGPVGNNAGNNSDNNAGDNAGNYAGSNAGNNVGTNAGNKAGNNVGNCWWE